MKSEWIIQHKDSGLFRFSSSLAVDFRLKLKLGYFHHMLLLVDILTVYEAKWPKGEVFPKVLVTWPVGDEAS